MADFDLLQNEQINLHCAQEHPPHFKILRKNTAQTKIYCEENYITRRKQEVAGFLFVLSAFGRIQIHRQISKFREQYNIFVLINYQARKQQYRRIGSYSADLCKLAKKEKEKSKRKEENGARKINTLISEKASSLGLPLFFQS